MGLCDRTYWWVACDAEGCHAGDSLDDADQPGDACQIAENAGFVKRDGRWLCEAHAEPFPRRLPSWCANPEHGHQPHMNNGECYRPATPPESATPDLESPK